ncbi:MAG: GDP-mannose 4,6-dehydratase [Candidatus Theseobacter exili]|nr:GDP-mannose 4,6-dehydratase [Candidatus Theseobacter exili]
MTCVLITGGAGFIGSHLAESLVKTDVNIKIIDDLSTGRIENLEAIKAESNVDVTVGNIIEDDKLDTMIEEADIVFHLAASVGVKNIVEYPLRSIMTNVKGTSRVLELAAKYHKKVLIASTSEVYGKNNNAPLNEDSERILGTTKVNRWCYSNSKALDEYIALAHYRTSGLPVIIVRLFNTCGPRQLGQYGMVLPNFVRKALQDKPIQVFGDGRQTRCFTHVNDVVVALTDLVEKNDSVGEIFNIGSSEEVSINELAAQVKKITQSKSEIVHIPYDQAYEKGFEDMRRRVPDISKIKRFIDWEPENNLENIIRDVIDYELIH